MYVSVAQSPASQAHTSPEPSPEPSQASEPMQQAGTEAVGVGEMGEIGTTVAVVVLGGAILAGIGWLMYRRVKLYDQIAQKEGSSGVLKLAAGEAAIGVASQWLSPHSR